MSCLTKYLPIVGSSASVDVGSGGVVCDLRNGDNDSNTYTRLFVGPAIALPFTHIATLHYTLYTPVF